MNDYAIHKVCQITGWDRAKTEKFLKDLDYGWYDFVDFMLTYAREPNEKELQFIKKNGSAPLIVLYKSNALHNQLK